MLEMTNENFARLLRGLTIAVGNRRNRILLYQFLAAEIRALHCSYGVGDAESYKRALTFLENCERYTLRSLVRRSAKHHAEVTVDHAKRVFSRACKPHDREGGERRAELRFHGGFPTNHRSRHQHGFHRGCLVNYSPGCYFLDNRK
jgi:hypothetical protein